jgi:8-hydroxy-5-deazaflavin:NADPH oxidoreductase
VRVGILGSGDVGRVLGRGFAAKRDDDVMIGSRSPHKLADWQAEAGENAAAGAFEEAAAHAELAVLATGWSGTENAIGLAGPQNIAGKVVIDVTNPLIFTEGGPPALALGHDDSGGEMSRYLEPLAMVWIVHGFRAESWAHAFRLLRGT